MRVLLLALLVAAAAAASTPGGLSPEETPQFVLLSHDDAIDGTAMKQLRRVSFGKDANGCPVVGTAFVLVDGTSCGELRALHSAGWEVAVHAVNHKSFKELDQAAIVEQLAGGRDELADCGIPEDEIVGHRSPYLDTTDAVFDALAEAGGFEYDSTIIRNGDFGSRSWPYSHKGVTEVPVWVLNEEGGSFSMDYADDEYGGGGVDGDVYGVLKANFDAAYNGNRAPMPLYIHTPYLQQNAKAFEQFIDYAAAQPNTYFVTMQQLLRWMDNPVPISELSPSDIC